MQGSYWKIGHFYESRGKPGIVREFSVILIKVREIKLFSQHAIFINYCHGCLHGCSHGCSQGCSQCRCSTCCQ